MTSLDYAAAGVPVRDDARAAHAFLLEHLRRPGTWWTGAERVAIAAESRNALACALCRERRGALSPNAIAGEHATLGAVRSAALEAIHRIRSDPARLSRRWFEGQIAGGLRVEEYVELVGVVTQVAGLDAFCRALGIPPFALPEPVSGEPERRVPAGAKAGIAWLPIVAPEDLREPDLDLYGGAPMVPNIVRALSLVPAEVRALQRQSDAHYVPLGKLTDPRAGRALSRPQIELVAARVSALNQCFY
jgi:hypothetical protein